MALTSLTPRVVTVILADPHPGMTAAVRRLLDSQSDIEVLAQATDRATTARLLSRHQPDVLILDPVILGSGGLGTLAMLRQASPRTQVLLVGMDDEVAWSSAVRQTPGMRYLSKSSPAESWVSAVHAAADRRDQER